MPYGKTFRKKRYRKSVSSVSARATKALTLARSVASKVNVEYKTNDSASNVGVSTTAQTIHLTGLTKGDDYNNRDGRSVCYKSIEMDLYTIQHASATATVVRYVLVLCKNGLSAPTFAGIFDTSSAQAVIAHRNLTNRKNYVILWDKLEFMDSASHKQCIDSKFKKLNMHTIFNSGNAGDITDIENNALYLVMVSNEATNTPTVYYNVRLRFVDN